jgi:hypothetical protein
MLGVGVLRAVEGVATRCVRAHVPRPSVSCWGSRGAGASDEPSVVTSCLALVSGAYAGSALVQIGSAEAASAQVKPSGPAERVPVRVSQAVFLPVGRWMAAAEVD